MEERVALCCRAKTWTAFIGWFQVIYSILILQAGIVPLVDIWGVSERPKRKIPITVHFILLVGSFSLITAILLLLGSYKKRPGCLQAWIVYSVIITVFYVLGKMGRGTSNSISGGDAIQNVLLAFIGLAVQGFFLWIVKIRMKEIEDQRSA